MDSKEKARLRAELESLEERRKALEAELELTEESSDDQKFLTRSFFDSMTPTGRMSFIKEGGRVID